MGEQEIFESFDLDRGPELSESRKISHGQGMSFCPNYPKEVHMQVQEVMSTGVVTASPTDSVQSVVIKMLSRHCGAIPVIDDTNQLIGLVALRDILLPLYPNYGE